MYDYLYALVKLTSIAVLTFMVFASTSEKARSSAGRNFLWLSLGLCLCVLIILSNAIAIQNSRVVAFLFPEISCFIFFIGPLFYFSTTNSKAKSHETVIFHSLFGLFFFFGSIYQATHQDFLTADFEILWENKEPLLSVEYKSFLTKPLHILLFPIHFSIYLAAAIKKRIPRDAALFGIGIALSGVLLNLEFSGLWSGNGYLTLLFINNTFLLTFGFSYVLAYPLARIQVDELKASNNYGQFIRISAFLTTEKFLETMLTNGVSLLQLVEASDIPIERWSVFLSSKDCSFIQFKRQIRIRHVKDLIAQGALNNYSVDGLSQLIGYQSRTSFYAAFKEVEGISFSKYRETFSDSH